jgi:hypothetical protein
MAIIKNMSSKFGIDLSYHRIVAFNINYAQKKAVICIASYITKEARAANRNPIEEIDIEVPIIDYPMFKETSPIIQGYLWMKENVIGFENAVDDFDIMEPALSNESPN